MGWDAASPEQIEDMRDYICEEDGISLTDEQLDRGVANMTDEEVLDIIDGQGGYRPTGGGWVDTGGGADDHVSMAPHGQWVDG